MIARGRRSYGHLNLIGGPDRVQSVVLLDPTLIMLTIDFLGLAEDLVHV